MSVFGLPPQWEVNPGVMKLGMPERLHKRPEYLVRSSSVRLLLLLVAAAIFRNTVVAIFSLMENVRHVKSSFWI